MCKAALERGGSKYLQEVGGLDLDGANIGQPRLPGLSIQLPQAAQQTLHTDKIPPLKALRVLHQEGAVPAPQLDFEGLRTREKHHEIQPFEDGRKLVARSGD